MKIRYLKFLVTTDWGTFTMLRNEIGLIEESRVTEYHYTFLIPANKKQIQKYASTAKHDECKYFNVIELELEEYLKDTMF